MPLGRKPRLPPTTNIAGGSNFLTCPLLFLLPVLLLQGIGGGGMEPNPTNDHQHGFPSIHPIKKLLILSKSNRDSYGSQPYCKHQLLRIAKLSQKKHGSHYSQDKVCTEWIANTGAKGDHEFYLEMVTVLQKQDWLLFFLPSEEIIWLLVGNHFHGLYV
jgi:hypothetical protein